MIPTVTAVRMSLVRHRAELPLLVLGPALGTTATTLWSACAAHLTDAFDLLAWDLPGHGHNRPAPDEGFDLGELAEGVLRIVDDVVADRGEPRGSFLYAGVSVGGAVGLQLLLDAPDRVDAAALLCTGARLGTERSWAERVAQVRASGTSGQVPAATGRWFTGGFVEREPERGAALLQALEGTLDDGYVQVCDALAGFDVRDRLGEVAAPVLAIAGSADVVAPPALLRELADGVRHGTYAELEGANLVPAEAPEEVAGLLRRHFLGERDQPTATDDPGVGSGALDGRSRSIVALTVLVAGDRHDELAAAVREALAGGLDGPEVVAVLRQAAADAGRPADPSLDVAQQVLGEEGIRP